MLTGVAAAPLATMERYARIAQVWSETVRFGWNRGGVIRAARKNNGMKDLNEILPSQSPARSRAHLLPIDEILARLSSLAGSHAHRRERLLDFAQRHGFEPKRIHGFICLPRDILDALETDRGQL